MLETMMTRLKRVFVIKFAFDVSDRLGATNGWLLGAGLAFFLVLALVPLLLVGLWGVGHVYAHRPDEALHKIQGFLTSNVLPGKAGDEAKRLMWRAGISSDQPGTHAGPALLKLLNGHGLAGLIGFGVTVWAAMQIFINAAVAFNAAWKTTERRNWFQLRGAALGLLIGTGVLLGLSLAFTAVSTSTSMDRFAHLVPFQTVVKSFLFELAAVAASAAMYAAVYKFLPSPSAKVSWKAAVIGGVVAAVAFEIVKKWLSVYLLKPNGLYGELGNLIVFVVWIYYSMMILLLGATVSAVYADEVESARGTRLKRMASATPAVDAVSGNPALARAKERNRTERLRKNGQKNGQSARK